MKYLEPDQKFMPANSFHHQVEQRMRQRKRVENFHGFVKIVESCGKSLFMSFNDFLEIPLGLIEMSWKTSYAKEKFKSSRFLQRKYEKNIGKGFQRNKEN